MSVITCVVSFRTCCYYYYLSILFSLNGAGSRLNLRIIFNVYTIPVYILDHWGYEVNIKKGKQINCLSVLTFKRDRDNHPQPKMY